MSSQISKLFWDPKFLSTYIFGLIIIVMYAKDKFNMPTYDRAAMGPFAQLPPQSLTMDKRYRQGRTSYIFMLLCLYTVVCIVGPSISPDLFNLFKQAGPQMQLGPQIGQPGSAELWPVAAATFLISTGASSDSSILGKIEFYVRQYAHKSAYIPRTVRDLARYMRDMDVLAWLNELQRGEDRDDRRLRLSQYAGNAAVQELEAKKEQAGGELTRWIRANALFLILQDMFDKSIDTTDGRLDELTDLPANKEILASLKGAHDGLYEKVVGSDKNFLPGKGEVARFAKDVSLLLAVLLSQSARNQTELDDQIRRLGIVGRQFRQTDSSTFLTAVTVALFLGVVFASVFLFVTQIFGLLQPYFDLSGIGASRDLSDLSRAVDIYPWLALMINASLSYLIAFRVLVYCRDDAMESREWVENIASRCRVILMASGVSSVLSVIAVVLFFSVIDKLSYVMPGFTALVHMLLLQFLMALLLSSFSLWYLSHAPKLRFSRTLTRDAPSYWNRVLVCARNHIPWLHGATAAALVGLLSLLATVDVRNTMLTFVRQGYEQTLGGILTNQQWIRERLTAQGMLSTSTTIATTGAAPNSDAVQKAGIDADARVRSIFDLVARTPEGPIHDLDRDGPGFRDSLAAWLRWILGLITPPIFLAPCRYHRPRRASCRR
ncbi:MAG: hypothetical protein FJX62_21170, partial [Alphaproteobacteria bacterium]|nr:hypothetical protein [Alphaproteobacteria bacterium]